MEDDSLGGISDHDLMAQLEVLANKGGGVHFPDFARLIVDGSAEITVSECWEIFQFACDQLGFWEAEWSFSLIDSPNHSAELEVNGWEILCRNLFNSLVEQMPDQQSLLEKSKHQTVLLHLLTRRVEYNEGKPFTKLTAFVLSKMSFIFKRFGFHRIGVNLYERGLYPKGTVARP